MNSTATLKISNKPAPIKPPSQERGKKSAYVDTNFRDEPATDPEAGSIQLTK
jgi:hypothetical protein